MRLNLNINNKIILGSAPTLTLVNPLFLIFSDTSNPLFQAVNIRVHGLTYPLWSGILILLINKGLLSGKGHTGIQKLPAGGEKCLLQYTGRLS